MLLNSVSAMWSTRHTVDTKEDKELYIKTTLRELVIYLLFLAVLCACECVMMCHTVSYSVIYFENIFVFIYLMLSFLKLNYII